MALTHVVMWDNGGWKDITIEEAKRLHPGGTVSARSGLFMCKLCHQNVTLTNGQVYSRYFKHERDNFKSMRCPDYSDSNNTNYNSEEHITFATIPIKLLENKGRLRIQLGLYHVDGMNSNDTITITPHTSNDKTLETNRYSLSRIPDKGIVYLDVDHTPAAKYELRFENFKTSQHGFPSFVQGINDDGALFDYNSGKMIPIGADITASNYYYLLIKNKYFHTNCRSMSIRKKCDLEYEWSLYTVYATNYDEYAARFYFELGYLLTDKPVKIYPIWPSYTESPYIINHDRDEMYMFVQGHRIVNKVFPSVKRFLGYTTTNDNKVLLLNCNSRQQLLSSGRDTSQLRSVYLWKMDFDESHIIPTINITDYDGEQLDQDKYYKLPKKKIIQINAEYDYKVIISAGEEITNILFGKANTMIEIDEKNLNLGKMLSVYIGNDCVRRIEFVRQKKSKTSENDKQLISMLNSVGGKRIVVPNELRNIAGQLDINSELRRWIIAAIKRGFINYKAYKLIVDYVNKGGFTK